jgi:hypothetical protein
MARKIKIDNAIIKRRSRKEKKRLIGFKSKRMFYLIVCEGEKTEPNYFSSLKESLPKGVLELTQIDIDGTGKNTLSIIVEAKKLRKRYEEKYLRKIDKVWAVFDKDSFPSKNFNNAINKGEHSRPKINCAWTNEAFELWYLLHFSYYNTSLSRHQYQKLLEKEIIKASGKKGYKYKKNSTEMYALLNSLGNQDFAISNAEKLEKLYNDRRFSNHNPCTKVHLLIKELKELTEEYASQQQI